MEEFKTLPPENLKFIPDHPDDAEKILKNSHFLRGNIYFHFYTEKEYNYAADIMSEFTNSGLTAEEFIKYKDSGLPLDEFKKSKPGIFVAKKFGF